MSTAQLLLLVVGGTAALAASIATFGAWFFGWSWQPGALLYGTAYYCRFYATRGVVERSWPTKP